MCEAVEPRRLLAAAPAGLAVDTTWGDGRLVTDLMPGPGSYDDATYDAAVLPDGDVVLAGASGPAGSGAAAIVRYNADGSFDTDFGSNGVVTFAAGGARRTTWRGVRATADGKILVAGSSEPSSVGAASPVQPLIARYNADGTRDRSFGTDGSGIVRVPPGMYSDIDCLEVLPDGRILAGGYARPFDAPSEGVALWRYNADGTPDTTFGVLGRATYDFSNIAGNETIASLAALPDGRIFAAGQTFGFYVFDAAGAPLTVQPDLFGALGARQGQDKALLAKPWEGGLRIVRYLADGTVDPSFATVDTRIGDYGNPRPAALLPRPDGSLLVGANVIPQPSGDAMAFLARVRPDGTRDVNFGGGGFPQAFLFTGGLQDGLRRLLPVGPARVLAAGYGVPYTAPGDTSASTNFISTRLALDPGIIADGHQTGPAVEGGAAPLSGLDSSYAGGSIAKYEWDADYQNAEFTPDATGATTILPVGDDRPAGRAVLRVTTSDGLAALSGPLALNIQNLPPVISAFTGPDDYAPLQTQLSFTGFVSDPADRLDSLDVWFDYGDGSGPVRTSVSTLNGSFDGTHSYSRAGTYTASVTIDDGDGGTATREVTVHVVDVVGTVFRDLNDDGRDISEPPVEGVKVFVDTDGDGIPDEGEPSTTSDAAGAYHFGGLPAGTFNILAVPPAGLRLSNSAADLRPVEIGTVGRVRNFGLTDAARIVGTVFNDLNADGVRSPTEQGLLTPNDLFLDLDDDGFYDAGEPLADAVSAVPGPGSYNYVFRNLAPGTYKVRFITGIYNTFGTSYVQTSPGTSGGHTGITVTVGPAETAAGNDFGAVRATRAVSGMVFEDRDRSGTRNNGEGGLGGRVVYLDADNDGTLDPDESRTRTGDAVGAGPGVYSMMVPAGRTAVLRLLGADGWVQTLPADGGAQVVDVSSGGGSGLVFINNIDFGAYLAVPATVVGRQLAYNTGINLPQYVPAPGKAALLPGGRATFANVSGERDGIRALFIDVRGLTQSAISSNTWAQLFALKTGSSAAGDPPGAEPTWTDFPSNGTALVSVQRGAGAGGSDRVVLTLGTGLVKNNWIQVTVLANQKTGLAQPDVFYFGSLPGETGAGESPAANALRVSALDLGAVKRKLNSNAGLDVPEDVIRDGRVNALDLGAVKANLNRTLALFTAAPVAPAVAAAPIAPASVGPLVWNSDVPAPGEFTRVWDELETGATESLLI